MIALFFSCVPKIGTLNYFHTNEYKQILRFVSMQKSHLYRSINAKSESELREIVEDKNGYTLEARMLAAELLEVRTGSDFQVENIKAALVEEETAVQYRKERKERFFYIPKNAPIIVKVIGIFLYVLYGSSAILVTYNLIVGTFVVNGLMWLLIAGFFFVVFATIDGILKGKKWARFLYLAVLILAVVYAIVTFILIKSINTNGMEINPLRFLSTVTEIVAVILLFLEPASQWFNSGGTRNASTELLDDF